jgi:hypothetical protein
MVLEISVAVLVAKPGPEPYVPCVPCNQPVKLVPGGVNTWGRNELLAQIQGPQSSMAEGLAAQVEDSFQWEGWRACRPLLPPLPVRL